MEKKYIAYYRVSTERQGRSGLGLEAQKQAVESFVNNPKLITHVYQEVESGTKTDRPELEKAINMAKSTGATLVIAKLDRLSRNALFTLRLRDSGVNFVCADMPEANHLTIGLLSVIAEDEAKRISDRVKGALEVIKKKTDKGQTHVSKSGNRITGLGTNNLTQEGREKGQLTRQTNARNNQNNLRASGYIRALFEQGLNFAQITKKLNENGFVTSRGKEFNPVQTKRLYEMFKDEK